MATYISLDNLARYDLKAKARAKDTYADASAACWQKTEKAGAVTCVPAPETPLEPVVEFLFKETLSSGDKSPSNPSAIAGVTQAKVTRVGKNLCAVTAVSDSSPVSGISFTVNEDGSIVANANPSTSERYFVVKDVPVPAGTYTISGCPSGGLSSTYFIAVFYAGQTESTGDYGSGVTVTLSEPNAFRIAICIRSGVTASNVVFKPQLELGSTATAFEPYEGADYTVDLGATFYGGTLDVASGRLTVTHRMVEPSSGTVDISDRPALLPLEYTDAYGRTVTSDGNTLSVGSSGGQIVYRLANPYTVQINPVPIDSLPALDKTSPRVNTIYTDADSVQVGYAEHPAYTEELINNAILALGGNI